MDTPHEEPLSMRCADTTPRDRRHQMRFLSTVFAWAVVFLGASYLIKFELVPAGPLAWLTAALPAAVAILVMVVYARYLKEADELQKLIQLNSLGLGFGAGWVATCVYPLFERLGAPAADPGDYFLVMTIFFALGNLVGWRRFR